MTSPAPERRGSAERVRVLRIDGDLRRTSADQVVVEEPLRIWVRSGSAREVLGTTMRTPGHDLDLAAGLAVGEGVVRTREDLVRVLPCGPGDVDAVTVHVRPGLRLVALDRVGTVSSACGVCGVEAIEGVVARCPAVDPATASASILVDLPGQMRAGQRLFDRTGGLHAAGIAGLDGIVHTVREDVGRHNAVDKAIGAALLADRPLGMLVVSGRAGFEIVQKAAMAGVPVVASVSAPTSLAVDLARATGMVLAGFVRDGRLNVYSGTDRIM